ncbi:MAG: hypothetical protein ACKPFK_12900, partial [Dolichospermum sp.]
LPPIEVLSDEVLGTANGAYSSSKNKIYLSASFLNTASSATIINVILEEIGHYVDAQINQVDSAGDEGAIFAELVRGNSLDVATLDALRAENDQTTIIVNGEIIQVEQNELLNIQVAGDSNPWLAGMPNGSTAYNDIAPDQSPVIVSELSLVAGSVLSFTVTGSVNNDPFDSGLTPDGGTFVSHSLTEENGIGQITAPINSLVAIFLDNNQPNLTSTNNNSLDFSDFGNVANGINYTTLLPELKQVFFIGDGLNDQGVRQSIIVPNGATRLFLGTMDGYGWYNNFGSFDVSVNLINASTITLAVAPSSVTEDGTTNLVYTFTRTGVTTNALTVNYTLGGTATL